MAVITLCLPREVIARLDRARGLISRSAIIREAIFRFVAQEEVRMLAESPQKSSRRE